MGLTLMFGGGPGDGKAAGINRLAHESLLGRIIGGHYGLVLRIGDLALAGKVEVGEFLIYYVPRATPAGIQMSA